MDKIDRPTTTPLNPSPESPEIVLWISMDFCKITSQNRAQASPFLYPCLATILAVSDFITQVVQAAQHLGAKELTSHRATKGLCPPGLLPPKTEVAPFKTYPPTHGQGSHLSLSLPHISSMPCWMMYATSPEVMKGHDALPKQSSSKASRTPRNKHEPCRL